MDESEAIRSTFANLRTILENVDFLLAGADRLLIKSGFKPRHTGVQCDLSKAEALGLLPRHVTRYYEYKPNDDSERLPWVIAVGCMFAGTELRSVDPILACAVFQPRERGWEYGAWWLHSAVYDDRLEPAKRWNGSLPGGCRAVTGYQRSQGGSWFEEAYVITVPLPDVNSDDDVARQVVDPLSDLFQRIRRLDLFNDPD